MKTLLKIGNCTLTYRHLLIIGILALSFSISFLLRSLPAEYGHELNEFDPFFHYRGTQYIVDNGYLEYLDWHDDMSWHPEGRNMSNSQPMLHLTAAVAYNVFGFGLSLYDFTILFPAVIGSLTTVAVFALVRVLGGTTAGLLSAMFFAVSAPVIVRGTIGWFKSEPLGLFYGILGMYILISGLRAGKSKMAIAKLVGSGMIFTFGLSAWGGNQFFMLAVGIFILALPFLNNNPRFQVWAVPLFTVSLFSTILIVDRPGLSFVTGLGGFSVIGPTVFLVACNLIKIYSGPAKAMRNSLILLACTMISGIALIAASFSGGFLRIPTFRYLNAINPFMTTQNPLVDSVSEHATTTLSQSFFFHSVLMIFAGIGIWMILSRRSTKQHDVYGLALVMGITGIYISSAFVRLEVFGSLGVIILSAIGISVILRRFFTGKQQSVFRIPIGAILSTGIIILLVMPLVVPEQSNWANAYRLPPTILNGGTPYQAAFSDWPDALDWIRENTPEDSVVAAWWDYGYWITTLGERITLADNGTLNDKQIAAIARILLSSPDEAWQMLQEFDADYILVFVTANRVSNDGDTPLYALTGGGDESKKTWFMRIAGEPVSKYVHEDGTSGTPYFWNETLLGKLFPYTVVTYFDQGYQLQHDSYRPGTVPIYAKEIKYQGDDGPFKLAYASPSYLSDSRVSVGVFIYELNKDYVPVHTDDGVEMDSDTSEQ